MEIIERAEVYEDVDGDLKFQHTHAIIKQGDRLFSARTGRRMDTFVPSDLPASDLFEFQVPIELIRPKMDHEYTPAPEPLPDDCYVKQPSLLDHENEDAMRNLGLLLLQEAKVYEILRRHPHPNIARFLGCVVEDRRLKGLCLAKYSANLGRLKYAGKTVDVDKCLGGIEDGIRHLHSLGLIHNDINPSNIVMDGDEPVIIDFDSCVPEGEPLGYKRGTFQWSLDETVSERENDLGQLDKIRKFLEE